MILERTTNKERVKFWIFHGFIKAKYNNKGYIEEV